MFAVVIAAGLALWWWARAAKAGVSEVVDSSAAIPDFIREVALRIGVDPGIAVGVGRVESGFNPRAVSPKGALGVMQLMPGTAAGLGVSDPFNPQQNVTGGVRYLSQLLDRYGGDYEAALAAYNWGERRVDSAIAAYGDEWDAHIPAETSSYIDSVLNAS